MILKLRRQSIFFQPFVAARTWERPPWQSAVAIHSFYIEDDDHDGDKDGDHDDGSDDNVIK